MNLKISLLSVSLFFNSMAFAAFPDGTKWLVTGKHCGTLSVKLLPGEKVQFADSLFAKSSISSEDQTKQCIQGMVYTRVIQSFNGGQDDYYEEASITPTAKKTQCTEKSSGTVITNEVHPWSRDVISMSVSLKSKSGTMNIYGSVECNSSLLLDLTLKE